MTAHSVMVQTNKHRKTAYNPRLLTIIGEIGAFYENHTDIDRRTELIQKIVE